MQDPHIGKAGTFYSDPETGTRLTQKQWDKKTLSKKDFDKKYPKQPKTTKE